MIPSYPASCCNDSGREIAAFPLLALHVEEKRLPAHVDDAESLVVLGNGVEPLESLYDNAVIVDVSLFRYPLEPMRERLASAQFQVERLHFHPVLEESKAAWAGKRAFHGSLELETGSFAEARLGADQPGHPHIGLNLAGDADCMDSNSGNGGFLGRVDQASLGLDSVRHENDVTRSSPREDPTSEANCVLEV
jgi:hypothetical protein